VHYDERIKFGPCQAPTELRPATLEWQAEEFEARTGIHRRRKPKPVTAQSNRDQATRLFKIFQEILTNVARHARSVRST
jgi:two-component system, NarL family, sensor histidine kinase UhpB